MRSAEIRSELKHEQTAARDTHRIHALARALARERLHLGTRPRRRTRDRDLLWGRGGSGYKVASRTVRSIDEATVFEVAAGGDADYLLCVFVEKGSFRLLGMIRIPWSMVEWLGRVHGTRLRLPWSESSAVRGVAEML
jgi:hypothetical protein